MNERQTNDRHLKIELLSQWKLEAESRNLENMKNLFGKMITFFNNLEREKYS